MLPKMQAVLSGPKSSQPPDRPGTSARLIAPLREGWRYLEIALVRFYLTGAIVFLGVCLGQSYLVPSRHQDYFHTAHDTDLAAHFANWDGQWYLRIARDGYFYDPNAMSSVAFFPGFPLAGRCLAWVCGLDMDVALTMTANLCFLAALALLSAYVHQRPDPRPELADSAPLAMALFPVGFFFRMAYSESLFVLLAVVVFYGLARRWPFLLVAGIVGLATAVRPIGIALVPPLMLTVCRRQPGGRKRAALLAAVLPLSLWGLAGYMAFQYRAFGDALAFAHVQKHWRFRAEAPRGELLAALASLEPIWSVYDETSPAYWRRYDRDLGPLFSLQFANPLYFVGIAGLLAYGGWKRWLTAEELLYGGGVLLIPYLTRSYEGCMSSQARFGAVAFPVYLVLGRFLLGMSHAHAAAAMAVAGFLLGVYSALFAGWFFFL